MARRPLEQYMRGESRVSAASLSLRGSPLTREQFERDTQRTARRFTFDGAPCHGISAELATHADDVDQLLREGRVRTREFVARIRAAGLETNGFIVAPTFTPEHHTIIALRAPAATFDRLIKLALTDVIRNPYRRAWMEGYYPMEGTVVGMIDIACDVQQVDETGYAWAFFDEALNPDVITVDNIVIAGAEGEPAYARVVDIVGQGADRIVHLDVLPGVPAQYRAAAERARLADIS